MRRIFDSEISVIAARGEKNCEKQNLNWIKMHVKNFWWLPCYSDKMPNTYSLKDEKFILAQGFSE